MTSKTVKSFQAEKDIFSPNKTQNSKTFHRAIPDSFSSSTQLTYPK